MELLISTPRNFSFKRTAISHGWYGLLPFELDREHWTLSRALDLKDDKPVTVAITARKGQLRINTSRRLTQKASRQVLADVRHMLRLDDDMAGFYGLMSREDEFAWVAAQGAGRMLRSPTVFEDLVKMICTTNCSWALTVNRMMVAARFPRPKLWR
jgi:3-methyladenine DNA glycosylase/8-oxoguanine DNA glycosylase